MHRTHRGTVGESPARVDARAFSAEPRVPVQDVTLIRHAYIRTRNQNQGIGSHLLTHLQKLTNAGPDLDWNLGRCDMGNPLL